MTRRRLWSLTAIACLLLALPGLPSSWRAGALDATRSAARATAAAVHSAIQAAATGAESGFRRLPATDPRTVQLAVAAGIVLLGGALLVRRHRLPGTEQATRLARRGRAIPVIARQTRLSQDAVRDLLGGDPRVVSAAVEGRFFRRGRRSQAEPAATFADELRERSFDARA